MKNLLFYKYVEIENLEGFQEKLLGLCLELELKGKILIASEGINGCVSGEVKNADKFKELIRKDPRFSDLEFKEGLTTRHNFKRTIVKIRNEIITSKFDADVNNRADYIEPEELKELYDNDEDFIIVDARNNYESGIGKFKNAIAPDIDVFSEWPKAAEQLEKYKDKPIITYCTGGIRCEKASAYLKQKGFTNVRQLHGGILNYGKKFGNDNWEGKCFVFDRRILVDLDEDNPIPNSCDFTNIIGYNKVENIPENSQ